MIVHTGTRVGKCLTTPSMTALRARLQEGRAQRIIAFGTSLTSEWSWRIWRRCGGHWVRLLRAHLNDRYGDLASLANVARWGGDSAWAVRRVVGIARSLAADAAVVEFAINDADERRGMSLADSRRNLAEVLDVMSSHWRDCDIHLLVTNPVFGRHEDSRPRLQDYYDVVRGLARERNVGLIDMAPAWQLALAQCEWHELLPDGIHPGEKAARWIILPQVQRALGL